MNARGHILVRQLVMGWWHGGEARFLIRLLGGGGRRVVHLGGWVLGGWECAWSACRRRVLLGGKGVWLAR